MEAIENFYQETVRVITKFKKANQPACRIHKRGKLAAGDFFFALVLMNFNCISHSHAVIMKWKWCTKRGFKDLISSYEIFLPGIPKGSQHCMFWIRNVLWSIQTSWTVSSWVWLLVGQADQAGREATRTSEKAGTESCPGTWRNASHVAILIKTLLRDISGWVT